MKTIAIVEDDRLLNEALSRMLSGAGYRVLRRYTLQDGIQLIYEDPDLMIIDIGLPDGEGTEICRRAGDYSRIPVLFLTARDEERDMLEAFDLGADDYLVKPFPMAVLLKHVEAILRRTGGEENRILYRGLTIDPDRKAVFCDGREVRLTPREYSMLDHLLVMTNSGCHIEVNFC